MKSFLHTLCLTAFIGLFTAGSAYGQCDNSILTNGSFESDANSDWWNWHDNSPDAYSFVLSDDSFGGDSSVVINVLVDTDDIPGGQGGEYNSRPQTNSVIGGQFYEIRFYAKSTIADTRLPIYIKDENDAWVQLHSDFLTVGTEWTEVTSLWQADEDRDDVHLEIKVYNEDFHEPYSVTIDEVSICAVEVLTNTCEDNIVTNPGFEDGADMEWAAWHGGEVTDYTFSTGAEGYVGNASAMISVLKAGADLTGAGEYNSRPQVSPVVAGQNYKVSLWGKSTVENTTLQVFVKDEFDGWTTLGNADLVVGTEWTEASFILVSDVDRDDVHVEIKVANPDFTAPYDVLIDEISMCTTDEEPGDEGGEEVSTPTYFGNVDAPVSCSSNLSDAFAIEDMMNDGMGWDIWDGSDDEDRSVFELDPVFPYSGDASMRIDVVADNNVAEFHHRFGNDLVLEEGKEYTVTMWMRTDLPAGDSIRAYTRAVRDTDWTAQFDTDFVSSRNEWLNYSHTFVATGDWDNAFLEIKFFRLTGFTEAYSIWVDDIQFCNSDDATVSVDDLTSLGVAFGVAPNPSVSGVNTHLTIDSERVLPGTQMALFDLLGRNVWNTTTNLFRGNQRIELPTGNLPAGIYVLNVWHNGYTHNLKVQVAGVRP